MSDHLENLRVLLDSLQKEDPKEVSLEALIKDLVSVFESLELVLQRTEESKREEVLEEIRLKVAAFAAPFLDLTKKTSSDLLSLSHQVGSSEDWMSVDEGKAKLLEIGVRVGKELLLAPNPVTKNGSSSPSASPGKSGGRFPRKDRWMKS